KEPAGREALGRSAETQLRCLETAAVILSIEIWPFPITAPSLASGLIMRLSLESCRLLALMWSHTSEVTWARVIGPLPTTPSSSGERFTGLFSALFLAAIIQSFPLLTLTRVTPRRPHPSPDHLHRCARRSRSRPQRRSHAPALHLRGQRGWRLASRSRARPAQRAGIRSHAARPRSADQAATIPNYRRRSCRPAAAPRLQAACPAAERGPRPASD